jgi:methionine sulfoxide reductase heme-binding subunit
MPKLAKPAIFLAALAPAAYLLFRTFTGRLTANPIEDITLTTGIWALRFLVLTLAVTPARRITKWNDVVRFRRMLGLFAFFYATLHLATFVVLDHYFDVRRILADIVKRPYITMGSIAFLSMLPLALTSTKGWIRRLGRKWQALHRLIYLSGIAAAIHYLWKVKVMVGSPVYYAAAVAALLLFRLAWRVRNTRFWASNRAKPASTGRPVKAG